jgi:pentatricopeptide repeat protein
MTGGRRRYYEDAMALFERMEQEGHTPDVHSFVALTSCFRGALPQAMVEGLGSRVCGSGGGWMTVAGMRIAVGSLHCERFALSSVVVVSQMLSLYKRRGQRWCWHRCAPRASSRM